MVKIISGGQTGADLAGLWIASCFSIPTGGWAPAGWKTQIGSQPELTYWDLVEHKGGYKPRTIANVEDADLTIVCSAKLSPGTRLTINACNERSKPLFVFLYEHGKVQSSLDRLEPTLDELTNHIKRRELFGDMVLNVAGNSTQTDPGAFEFTFRLMWTLLVNLGYHPPDLRLDRLVVNLQDKYPGSCTFSLI